MGVAMNGLKRILFFCFAVLSIIACRPVPQPTSQPLLLTETETLIPTSTAEEFVVVNASPVSVSRMANESVVQNEVNVEFLNTHIPADGEYGGGLPFTNPQWSNNGRFIAYLHDYGVWIANVDDLGNSQEIYLSQRSSEFLEPSLVPGPNLAWSPDDNLLAFTAFNFETHETGVAIYNRNTNQVDLFSENVGAVVDWGDRGLIACDYVISGCYILDAVMQLNQQTNIGVVFSPFFSDTNELIFGSEANLVVKNLETGKENIIAADLLPRLTSWQVNAVPVPSPDGNYIAWVAQDTLSQINLFDREEQKMIHLPEMVKPLLWSSISWSPDSQQLIFVADGTIWIMRLDL